ncbi:MAG: hypothetical protein AB1772_02395 [Candidatus Zixiibacteriota bacterium]
MIYKLNFNEGVMEFCRNHGRAFLEAAGPKEAVLAARGLFEHTRDERVKSLGPGRFMVTFKVNLDYRLPLVRGVEKAVKLLRTVDLYQDGRYIDRYAVATVFMETGSPDYLTDTDIKEEISTLRKAAVVAREVPSVVAFIDYDIAIYNYLELNTKQGYRSRVVRKTKVTSASK